MQQKLLIRTKTMQVAEAALGRPLEDWLREEYVEKERRAEDLGEDLGRLLGQTAFSPSTISRWLGMFGIPVRRPGHRYRSVA